MRRIVRRRHDVPPAAGDAHSRIAVIRSAGAEAASKGLLLLGWGVKRAL
jgi:hypothetical protein